MIYHKKPRAFTPKFRVVSCFCEYEGQFILLLRQDHKDRGNLWGVPAGKIDAQEGMEEAMLRELREETGIVSNNLDLEYIKKVYVRYPDYDFEFNIFRMQLKSKPELAINLDEHKEYIWVTPQESLNMDLVPDFDECVRICYAIQD